MTYPSAHKPSTLGLSVRECRDVRVIPVTYTNYPQVVKVFVLRKLFLRETVLAAGTQRRFDVHLTLYGCYMDVIWTLF